MGKFKQVMSLLERKFKKTHQGLLHILVSDSESLISSLVSGELATLQEKSDIDFDLLQWGAGRESESISKLAARASKATRPLLLVTTMSSLRSRIFEGHRSEGPGQEKVEQLRSIAHRRLEELIPFLNSYSYDEVHHSSAPLARLLMEELFKFEKKGLFVNGSTATPNRTILNLFGPDTYWAYLDNSKEFLSRASDVSSTRGIEQIIEQITEMMDRGECTPFGNIQFIDPFFDTTEQNLELNLFSKRNDRLVLDPKYIHILLEALRPYLEKGKQAFMTVGTIDEVRVLVNLLRSTFPEMTFEGYHSGVERPEGSAQDEIDRKDLKSPSVADLNRETERRFRAGEIDVLVAVGKLDEGLNFPFLKTYFDLNHSFTARQFIQRLGRLLRLDENKSSVEVVSLMLTNEVNIRDNLALLDSLIELKVKYNLSSKRKESNPLAVTAEQAELKRLREFRRKTVEFWKITEARRSEIQAMRTAVLAYKKAKKSLLNCITRRYLVGLSP